MVGLSRTLGAGAARATAFGLAGAEVCCVSGGGLTLASALSCDENRLPKKPVCDVLGAADAVWPGAAFPFELNRPPRKLPDELLLLSPLLLAVLAVATSLGPLDI